ncbi:hypothetical protein [Frigoribacterium faeni]|uniref:Glycosyl hydrolase family 32 N-terminal domain-containing protein n=1 Tax=Frigoribacterium faeni TaxID=145483 RepID=A0A7W3PJE3_9MICO|nr:hypothetical protein [Frigoribacterium faeni]MBA8813973.1 hypothetical protein [Frigoribacterium faeni]BFF15313.1 hypothetical protein GCM10025699_66160 [Microbacterium flavescens]GEK84242.1 hypothetical protein FFA01_25510 [Frigoribacterium faeni]
MTSATPEPATPAPATPASETPAPAPETPAPATPASATPAPATPAPETPAPATPAPATHPYLVPLTRARLQQVLDDALQHRNDLTGALSQLTFSSPAAYGDQGTIWQVGPFAADDALTFTLDGQWPDPDGIGWTSDSLYNPSVIEHDGVLHLFYRASPRKESLGSRIGHATLDLRTPGAAWIDDPANPLVRPTRDVELLGVEDPKAYRAEGRWWLFHNGVFPITEEARVAFPSLGYPVEAVGIDILVSVSDDLVDWQPLGPITDHAQTRLWAKGAVIPRDEHGAAVRIGGEYLMFVSEGFDGVLHVGRSTDMATWVFEPCPYLDLSPVGGHLHEVAAAVVTGDGHLVLDVFHDVDGVFAASQVLYDLERPFEQLAVAPGGSLSWGGLQRVGGRWTFAQGWDAPPGRRDLYFYRDGADGADAPDTTPPRSI